MAGILIVDDSRDILEVMKDILEMEGHDVRIVPGKAGMLKELKNFIPDLIILDVLLSRDNGRDICKELRKAEETKDIPVLLMSASPSLLGDYEECGATDVIAKPFHLNDLTEKVRAIINFIPILLINIPAVSQEFIHHFRLY